LTVHLGFPVLVSIATEGIPAKPVIARSSAEKSSSNDIQSHWCFFWGRRVRDFGELFHGACVLKTDIAIAWGQERELESMKDEAHV
jgi:hypothetical protein